LSSFTDNSAPDDVAGAERPCPTRKEILMTSIEYALGHSESETRRLILQAQIFGPITRRFFQAAGIGAGMKVLDIGSGAGDVALLVADLVGPRGRVVGVERNEAILDTARARVESAGWHNVTFMAGDALEIPLDSDFDAVVGRWILMHLPDPVAVVRHVASLLRVGGIVAFHENDFHFPPALLPASELSNRIQKWAVPPPGAPGPEMRMGTQLLKTYIEAGLPRPELIVEAAAGGGADWPGYEYLAETLRSLLPALEKLYGVDPAEVQIDTLAERVRHDVVSRHAIQFLPMMFGAWTKKTG
jgi:ubiquinone/menaquinone biosynthesis C-methylase UbiE